MSDELEQPVSQEVKTESTESAAELLSAGQANSPIQKQNTEAPKEEHSEFDIDLDEKVELTPSDKRKFEKARLKELDDDIDSDEDLDLDEKTHNMLDKVLSRAKEYKTKANEYKTIAESHSVINNDEYVKTWAAHIDLENDQLIRSVEIAKYQKAGFGEEEAAAKADEAVAELRRKRKAI